MATTTMDQPEIEEGVERIVPPPLRKGEVAGESQQDAADIIRLTYKGVRVRVTGLPSRRTVSDAQKKKAADLFEADSESVSMSTLLWNAKEDAVKELRKVIAAIHGTFHDRYWTLPTPHTGLRLLRKERLINFNEKMTDYRDQLRRRAEILRDQLPAIIERERERRAQLFSADDYNFDPSQSCCLEWSFQTVVEDRELAEIDDNIYQQELRRVRQELEASVRKCEEEMVEQLYLALSGAASRLGTDASGTRKKFKNTTVTKLFDELDYISTQLAENKIGGSGVAAATYRLKEMLASHDREVLPDALRRGEGFRQQFRAQCENLASTLLETSVPPLRRRLLINRASDDR